ncbi:MAG: hypothetical protein HGB11_16070, partial [Chlorobiales bacterium]|nr:hypothetical protein [Chlorobiales bacterium]
ALLLIVLVGCDSPELKQRVAELEEEKSRVQEENDRQKQYVEQITGGVTEIQKNLNLIRQREEMITKASSDIEKSNKLGTDAVKKDILKNISDIDTYLIENQKQLLKLEKKVRSSQNKIANLDKLVAELRTAVLEREAQIVQMKREIRNLNIQIAALESTVSVLDEVIEQQEKELVTAYYIVGTEAELEQKRIIETSGGILGLIGKTVVPAKESDPSHFTEIDISVTDEIQVNANVENVELITTHNASSYELVPKGNNQTILRIKDSEGFWQKTKYMIVLIRG